MLLLCVGVGRAPAFSAAAAAKSVLMCHRQSKWVSAPTVSSTISTIFISITITISLYSLLGIPQCHERKWKKLESSTSHQPACLVGFLGSRGVFFSFLFSFQTSLQMYGCTVHSTVCFGCQEVPVRLPMIIMMNSDLNDDYCAQTAGYILVFLSWTITIIADVPFHSSAAMVVIVWQFVSYNCQWLLLLYSVHYLFIRVMLNRGW